MFGLAESTADLTDKTVYTDKGNIRLYIRTTNGFSHIRDPEQLRYLVSERGYVEKRTMLPDGANIEGDLSKTLVSDAKYKIVPPPPATGKKVWVPGKIWTNYTDFLKDFPFAKTAILMLIARKMGAVYEKNGRVYIATKQVGSYKENKHIPYYNIDISKWDYENKMRAYEDVIRFAISPENPLQLNFVLNPLDKIAYSWYEHAGINMRHKLEHCNCFFGNFIVPPRYPKDGTMPYLKMSLGGLAAWYLNPVINNKKQFIRITKANEKLITDWIFKNAIQGFRVKTDSGYKKFKEIYITNIKSVDKVPKNTIAYTVTGSPPPVPKGIIWNTADLWSAIFNFHPGQVMLNAVGNNMPVKIKTKLNVWKNPEVKKSIHSANKDIYFYIFQDFSIEVGKNNNILIKYNRGSGSYQIPIIKEKNLWKTFLIELAIIIIIAVIIIATSGAGAAVVAGGSSGGIITAPVTLGSVTAPGITLGTVAPTMSVGTAVAGGGGLITAPILAGGAGLTTTEIIAATGTAAATGGKVYSLVEQKKAQKEAAKLKAAQIKRNEAAAKAAATPPVPVIQPENKFPFSSAEMITAAGISIPVIIIGSLIYKNIK